MQIWYGRRSRKAKGGIEAERSKEKEGVADFITDNATNRTCSPALPAKTDQSPPFTGKSDGRSSPNALVYLTTISWSLWPGGVSGLVKDLGRYKE